MIIVDASVAVKWIVDEPSHEIALLALELDAVLIAPDLLLAEFASVMRRKHRSGEVASEQIGPGLQLVRNAISDFIPSERLVEDALLLSEQMNHSPYDCMYLACALSRGKLLTADGKFIEKCQANGFGSVVIGLADIANGRYEALTAEASIGEEVLADIERLTPLIKNTFDHLMIKATSDLLGKFQFIPIESIGPAFKSPAYLRLVEGLKTLNEKQLVYLIALGWLGRMEYSGFDWERLMSNARNNEFQYNDTHKAYIMAQMALVRAGLEKLRAHYNLTD